MFVLDEKLHKNDSLLGKSSQDKVALFLDLSSNMFSSNRRNITGNGYDKKLLSLFQLVLQESGAKTAETIALASMEHNAIH